MRHNQCTLKPALVHAYAQQILMAELELRDYKQAVPAGLLASLLLLAACWQCALSAACLLARDTPSHESVRKALHACLPPRPRDLLERLLAALRRTLPDHLGRRPLPFALDMHRRPFYGDGTTKGCTRGKRKQGTRKAFAYATLAALAPEGRFTVGLVPLRPSLRNVTVVGRLLGQAAAAGLSVSYLLLDKEFYAAEVIDWLQRHGLAFLMPAVRRPGNRHLFAADHPVGWCRYSWETLLRRRDFQTGKTHRKQKLRVEVNMCVARHPKKDEVLVYASWGLGSWPPAAVVQAYRRRFGIEVSYRQLGQCLARTSSRNERVRLLLVGVALLLGNLWAYLHAEAFSRGALGERRLGLPLLRLLALRMGLALAILTTLGGLVDDWLAQRPLPEELTELENAL
jgi:hypothetical protein